MLCHQYNLLLLLITKTKKQKIYKHKRLQHIYRFFHLWLRAEYNYSAGRLGDPCCSTYRLDLNFKFHMGICWFPVSPKQLFCWENICIIIIKISNVYKNSKHKIIPNLISVNRCNVKIAYYKCGANFYFF